MEMERKAMEHELNIAHEIQSNLLPKKIPLIKGYDISAFYRASKEVGGDYYDIIQLDEHNIGVIVADVSGKGVPGSMVMTMTRALVRMEAVHNLSPADTLKKVNRIIATDIRRGMFVTALYLILNIKSHTILVSSAGHNPLVLWRKNKRACELLNPNGIALGFDKGPVFERTIKEQLIQLNWGDRIVAYTDGVVESMNPNDQEFGSERFYQVVNQLAEMPSERFIKTVVSALDKHQASAPQHDDITLVSVRFSG
jgi:sigma-B regulation protein RsbU (phosphoserine phosphatase)